MKKTELRYRLKTVCAKSQITRKDFVRKYWKLDLIPGMSIDTAYRYISNMLAESGSKIRPWLVTAIEMEEAENENDNEG